MSKREARVIINKNRSPVQAEQGAHMDIKKQITDVVEKVTKDKNLLAKFQKDPLKTVKGILGADLPDDVVKKVTDGVKAKIDTDKLTDKLGGLKKLF